MRAVIQRVSSASVTIDCAVKSAIGPGLLSAGIPDNQTTNDLNQKRYQRQQDREKNAQKDSGRAFVEDDDEFIGLL